MFVRARAWRHKVQIRLFMGGAVPGHAPLPAAASCLALETSVQGANHCAGPAFVLIVTLLDSEKKSMSHSGKQVVLVWQMHHAHFFTNICFSFKKNFFQDINILQRRYFLFFAFSSIFQYFLQSKLHVFWQRGVFVSLFLQAKRKGSDRPCTACAARNALFPDRGQNARKIFMKMSRRAVPVCIVCDQGLLPHADTLAKEGKHMHVGEEDEQEQGRHPEQGLRPGQTQSCPEAHYAAHDSPDHAHKGTHAGNEA